MVAAVSLALLKVMVRVETPPALMVAGLKVLLSVGGMGVTGDTPHTADGDGVGIQRHCTISRQDSTGHVCAGIEGDARERENTAYERSGCTESRGAADLPKDVAWLERHWSSARTSCSPYEGAHCLEHPDRIGSPRRRA